MSKLLQAWAEQSCHLQQMGIFVGCFIFYPCSVSLRLEHPEWYGLPGKDAKLWSVSWVAMAIRQQTQVGSPPPPPSSSSSSSSSSGSACYFLVPTFCKFCAAAARRGKWKKPCDAAVVWLEDDEPTWDLIPTTYWCLLSKEWMGMGVAGIMIHSYCGSFPKIPYV